MVNIGLLDDSPNQAYFRSVCKALLAFVDESSHSYKFVQGFMNIVLLI